MRPTLLAALLASALLAGCSGGDGEDTPPGVGDVPARPVPVSERVLLEEPFQATPAGAATLQVDMPADAHNVTVTVTVDTAAGTILDVHLEGCGSYSVTTNIVLQARTYQDVLCPRASPGPSELSVGGEGGAFTGTVRLSATVPGA